MPDLQQMTKRLGKRVGTAAATRVTKTVEQHRERGLCLRPGCRRKVARLSRHAGPELHCGRPQCANWAHLDDYSDEQFQQLLDLPDAEFTKLFG